MLWLLSGLALERQNEQLSSMVICHLNTNVGFEDGRAEDESSRSPAVKPRHLHCTGKSLAALVHILNLIHFTVQYFLGVPMQIATTKPRNLGQKDTVV